MKSKAILILLTLLNIAPLQALANPLIDCFDAMEQDPMLQPIVDKVSLSGKTDRLFGMMANENFPTSNEQKAIYAWAIKREGCVNNNPEPDNAITQLYHEGFNAVQALILDLINNKINYGEFAKQRREINKVVATRGRETLTRMQQQQNQQRQYRQQQEEQLNQACLNRAKNQAERISCGYEKAGRGIVDSINR